MPQTPRTPKVKEFVHSPFIKCPDCLNETTFGVLMVLNDRYVRRCINCWYDKTYPLPSLDKKVLYIDQFVVSNIMKALDPDREHSEKFESEEFFLQLFKRLDRLVKLQLVVLPESVVHDHESIVDTRYPKIRSVFKQLAQGVSFRSPEVILHSQINEAFSAWLANNPYTPDFNIRTALSKNPNFWQERFRLDFNFHVPGLSEELKSNSASTTALLHEVCHGWKNDANFAFEAVFENELLGHGRQIIAQFLHYCERFANVQAGLAPIDDEVCFPPAALNLVTRMLQQLEEKGHSHSERLAGVQRFFVSDQFKTVPSVRIASLFWATLAREIHSGRNPDRFPSASIYNDIDVVAAYSPFCDAMFVDREMSHLAKQGTLKNALKGRSKLFSLRKNEKSEFLNYLNDLEKNATPQHLNLVKEVYGENWGEPFTELLSYLPGKKSNT